MLANVAKAANQDDVRAKNEIFPAAQNATVAKSYLAPTSIEYSLLLLTMEIRSQSLFNRYEHDAHIHLYFSRLFINELDEKRTDDDVFRRMK